MIKCFLKALLFITAIILTEVSPAQDIGSISSRNLKSLNVDDLSDAQIGKLANQFEQSGYSEQQIEVLARTRGASESQIAKLKKRIKDYQSKRPSSSQSAKINRLRDGDPTYRESLNSNNKTAFDPFTELYIADSTQLFEGLPIFGLSFFENQNLTFEPSLNVPTPQNYQLGAGDQLIIDVWGASEQNYQLTVSPEGSVIIPNIGPIYLNGLSMDKAEARIKSKLKSIYSSLGRNTFAQVSLGQAKTISVNVIGEVNRPGTYQMSSFGTAFNALYLAGGPNQNGSLRKIKILRGGKMIANLDAYQFLVFGLGENIGLQDQDIVLVNPYVNRVIIDGEVKRPAVYETLPEESFEDVLNFTGGFSSKAYKKSISIRRNLENKRTVITIQGDQLNQFIFEDGDRIDVGAIQNQFIGRVRVEGAVNHPNEFELKEGMKLSELITLTDGFRADAFLKRAVIIRVNDDLSLSSIAFSVEELLSGNYDIEMKSEDLVKVNSIFDLQEDFNISIKGEVQNPGVYPFIEGMTVENLIFLANGFLETAAKSFVEVGRRITDSTGDGTLTSEIFNFPIDENLSISLEDSEFELKPFDIVVIRESPSYKQQLIVEIEGEITYPGKYVLQSKNERISDLVKRSGGLTNFAYSKGATLIRRNEYFDDIRSGTKAAARVKKDELKQLLDRDTLFDSSQSKFKAQELVGIQLIEILQNPGGPDDLILKEGDIISIPSELQTIRIRGEVLHPGTIRYEKSSFKKFVSQAGGFTDNAKKNRVYVINANGSARRTKSFLWIRKFPKIEPGTEIIVPQRPERRRLSPAEIISITSGLGTIALIINNLTSN